MHQQHPPGMVESKKILKIFPVFTPNGSAGTRQLIANLLILGALDTENSYSTGLIQDLS